MRPIFILSLVLLTGCGTLIPKKVEFFQKKIKPVPEATSGQKETERQAAALAAVKARQTVEAALQNNSPVAVIEPAKDTELLTTAVSASLGPPVRPYVDAPTNLVDRVNHNTAVLHGKIDSYRERIEPLVGKKIEGTGFIRINYFVYVGGLLALGFLVWTGLKIYGSVNPIVGLGTNIAGRIGSKTLSTGYAELVKGGEYFKEELAESGLAKDIQDSVVRLFRQSHERAQSTEHQDIVKLLTAKPTQV